MFVKECTLDETVDTSDGESVAFKETRLEEKVTKAVKNSNDCEKTSPPQKLQSLYQKQTQKKQIIQSYQHYHRSIPKHVIPTYATVPARPQSQPQPSNSVSRSQANQHSTYSKG